MQTDGWACPALACSQASVPLNAWGMLEYGRLSIVLGRDYATILPMSTHACWYVEYVF